MVGYSSRREREMQSYKEEMIKAAERVFHTKGYENSTMDEIAKECEFTKRTLYKYFSKKEDLLLSVLQQGLMELLSYIRASILTEMNGSDKFHTFISSICRFFKDNPKTSHLMTDISYINTIGNVNPLFNEFCELKKSMIKDLIDIIESGKRDGSINLAVDAVKTTYSIVFVLLGFLNELSMSGNIFLEHFTHNQEDFVQFTIDSLCRSYLLEDSKNTSPN